MSIVKKEVSAEDFRVEKTSRRINWGFWLFVVELVSLMYWLINKYGIKP
jgi:hypothetical protein